MTRPKIYADFHNADKQGRLRLNCTGTLEDLKQQHVDLRPGLSLTFYDNDADDAGNLDELLAEGTVAFSDEEQCWVAVIDRTQIHHASEIKEHSAKVPGAIQPATRRAV